MVLLWYYYDITSNIIVWYYHGITMLLLWCYHGVTMLLLWCYHGVANAIVTSIGAKELLFPASSSKSR